MEFMDRIPAIWADNSDKWRRSFSVSELKIIGQIIGKTLIEFLYENDEFWY